MRVPLFTLLFLLFSATAFAQVPSMPTVNEHVFDYANVIDEEKEEEMRALIQKIERETSNQVVLMTLETLDGMEMISFGRQMLHEWGMENNGMLIFATTGQGEGNNAAWISAGQAVEESFSQSEVERIIDKYMIGPLKKGDYTTAFYETLSIIGQEMLGEIEDADPYGEDDWFWWMVLIGFIAFLLWVIFKLGPKYGDSGDYQDYSSDSSSDSSGFGGGSSDGGGSGRSF